jgi:hypothetical protein
MFYRSLPVWVNDAAGRAGVSLSDITEAKVTAKQAVLTVSGEEKPVKVFRRHAFPGRSAE